ncbi:MAG: hypothetical protein WB804_14705, partial [Candidatus Dormiibacterota bacterium]
DHTRPGVAELCGISLSSVGRYLRRFRTTGSISLRIPTMPPGHTEVEASTCSNLMPSTVLR